MGGRGSYLTTRKPCNEMKKIKIIIEAEMEVSDMEEAYEAVLNVYQILAHRISTSDPRGKIREHFQIKSIRAVEDGGDDNG
tara:strand:+ start:282 stop:524 length:243 start_codon:yes stop_codon:yes gene_type:complete